MKKKIVGIIVCTLLIIATVIPVAGNIKKESTSPLFAINTSVDKISPYNIASSPLIITATGPSDLDSVALYYRWSEDNVSWTGFQEYSIFEGFESATHNTSLWSVYQSGGNARIQWDYQTAHSGVYSCAMDDADSDSDYSLNVIYTKIDFTDAKKIEIEFWEREWLDEGNDAPDSWEDWGPYDVVAFTNDGYNWYEIVSEAELNQDTFTEFQYVISDDPDFSSPPNSNFRIAFQQYDNVQLTNDGRAWDDITIEYRVGSGINWTFWIDHNNPDQHYPWTWYFDFPNGAGFYEFYSIGQKTGEPGETPPLVADAQCRFNENPVIFNEVPSNGSTDVELIPQLNISVSDAEEETMDMNWYSNSSGTWQIFGSNYNIGDGTYNQTNSNFSEFETTYWWYVTVTEDINTNSSPIFHFTTKGNQPPNTPSNPDPEDDETDVNIDIDPSWSGGDPNGDDVTYDVYFGKSSPPPKVVNKQSETTYDPGILDFNTEYYWKIVAWDEYDFSSSGPIWSFTTEENLPPNTPSNPDPEDGATDVPIEILLKWTGGDPNSGDIVTYDVYFGTDNPPPLVAEDLTQIGFDPETLDLDTTYYWQIVTEDSQSETTAGPIWHFTTELTPNEPPTAPEITGPSQGAPEIELGWLFESSDPDGNQIKYLIEWDDGSSDETDFHPQGLGVVVYHTYELEGTYIIKAKAEDEKGLIGEESTFEVTIPRSRSIYNLLLLWLFDRIPILEKLMDLIRMV
jgi:hypothetical protein